MGAGLIGSARRSNMIDVAYLYYLPFCMAFVSGDNLHGRLAPLFLRPDQRFVMASDLKAGLRQLNDHYAKHQEEIDRVGIIRFAPEPPAAVPTIVTTLWDELLLPRSGANAEAASVVPVEAAEEPAIAGAASATGVPRKPARPSNEELLKHINHLLDNAEVVPDGEARGENESVVMRHEVPVRRGRWRLVPEGIEKHVG
jgi:hypothetical protein